MLSWTIQPPLGSYKPHLKLYLHVEYEKTQEQKKNLWFCVLSLNTRGKMLEGSESAINDNREN
jgi:hypothetical protein